MSRSAQIVDFAEFLEPPADAARPPAPTPAEPFLLPPERRGLGAAPAPSLGWEEEDTLEDVFFPEALAYEEADAETVHVPPDLLRVEQELRESWLDARAAAPRRAPTPSSFDAPAVAPAREVSLADPEILPAGARLARLLRRRAPAIALAASLLALALSALALGREAGAASPPDRAGAPARAPEA
ncbi:MAG: hypothetical protein D6729_19765, partial [Deltaproteobacteria bacterium]